MARIPFNMPEAAIAGTTGVKIAATVFKIRLPNEFFSFMDVAEPTKVLKHYRHARLYCLKPLDTDRHFQQQK